jgi:hypothetical protein
MPRFRENSRWRSSWRFGKQRMEPGYTECGGSDTRLLRIHGNPKTAFRPHVFGGIGKVRSALTVTKAPLGSYVWSTGRNWNVPRMSCFRMRLQHVEILYFAAQYLHQRPRARCRYFPGENGLVKGTRQHVTLPGKMDRTRGQRMHHQPGTPNPATLFARNT